MDLKLKDVAELLDVSEIRSADGFEIARFPITA